MTISVTQKPHSQSIQKHAASTQRSAKDPKVSNSDATPVSVTDGIPDQRQNGKHIAFINKQASEHFHANIDVLINYQQDDQHASAQFKQQFSDLAKDPAAFNQLMQSVFGENIDIAQTEAYRTAALNNNFDWLPETIFVSAENMNGGMAAYSAEKNTIYINEDIRGTTLATQFYSEEAGHYLDSVLNETDTLGDEGELFQLRLSGHSLTDTQVNDLMVENDHGTILVDGEQQSVEFGGLLDYVKKKVIDPVVEVFIEPVVDIVKGGVDAVVEGATYLGRGVKDVLDGHVSRGLRTIIRSSYRALEIGVGATYDKFVVALDRIFHVMDELLNLGDERGLNAVEIQHLQAVFGNSVDYSEIRIQKGGSFDSIFNPDDAKAIRNTIYFPASNTEGESHFNADGTLTNVGLELLVHEATHVWQYQKNGIGYISNSGGTNLDDKWFGGDNPYDWADAVTNGVEFEDMKIEQQAELMEAIGIAIHSGGFTQALFRVNGNSPDNDQWRIIQAAFDTVRT